MNRQTMEIERAASYYAYHLPDAVMRRRYRGPNNTLLRVELLYQDLLLTTLCFCEQPNCIPCWATRLSYANHIDAQ
jgi:hypothetical protein